MLQEYHTTYSCKGYVNFSLTDWLTHLSEGSRVSDRKVWLGSPLLLNFGVFEERSGNCDIITFPVVVEIN